MMRSGMIHLAILLPAMAGCGRDAGEPGNDVRIFRPQDYRGQVDGKLPAALQNRQQVMCGVFNALLEGHRPEQMPKYFPDVIFKETSNTFYEGSARLVRWAFAGPPDGNNVPVEITLENTAANKQEPQSTRTVRRTYVVAVSHNGSYTIARK